MAEDSRGVYVSNSTLYDEVRHVADTLIRLESKVEATLVQMTATDVEMTKRLDDHETRLRSLEERRLPHSWLSVMAAVGATGALVWQAFGH